MESEEVLLVNEDRHLMDDNITLRNVIERATDTDFEKVTQFLLTKENNFKECCLRLSGVRSMIINLVDTPKENTELRSYLVQTITERIAHIFGKPGATQDDLPPEIQMVEPDRLKFVIAVLLEFGSISMVRADTYGRFRTCVSNNSNRLVH